MMLIFMILMDNHSTVSMMYSEEYSFLKEEHAVGFIKPYKVRL